MAMIFQIVGLFFLLNFSAQAQIWKTIDPGLAYTKIGSINAFRIDPKQFRFEILTSRSVGEVVTTVSRLAKKKEALLVINGGFFSPERKSLGLIVNAGTLLNPIHQAPWWAVFQIQKTRPSIIPHRQFQMGPNIEMALQVGPRLVVGGSTPKLKPSLARRSGIGIQNDGHVIIAASSEDLSIIEFALAFQKSEKNSGLACPNALNLDGGSSTQLYFDWNGFLLDLRGTSEVTNAIAVYKR